VESATSIAQRVSIITAETFTSNTEQTAVFRIELLESMQALPALQPLNSYELPVGQHIHCTTCGLSITIVNHRTISTEKLCKECMNKVRDKYQRCKNCGHYKVMHSPCNYGSGVDYDNEFHPGCGCDKFEVLEQ